MATSIASSIWQSTTLAILKLTGGKHSISSSCGRVPKDDERRCLNGRPIAIGATLYDVGRVGTFYLSLQNDDEGIFLKLRATPEHVSTITKQGSSTYDEYAVVQVTEVNRPEFQAKAEADSDTGREWR